MRGVVAIASAMLVQALVVSGQRGGGGGGRGCGRPDAQIDPCAGVAAGTVCSFLNANAATVCGVCGSTNRCVDLCVPDGSSNCMTEATDAPATDAPATAEPTAEPTGAPDTDAPPTAVPTAEPTSAPATDPPATAVPTAEPTGVPATDAPATDPPATDAPDTDAPATAEPTAEPTGAPDTDAPPTAVPTAEPTSAPVTGTPVNEADITCPSAPVTGNAIDEPCMDTHIVPSLIAPVFAHPTTLTSTAGRLEVTLTVEQHQLDAGAFKKNVRAFCYEGVCSVPGPTLRVFPGDTVVVTLVNNLLDVEPEQTTSDGEGLNSFREANITNMHTHGLHVDPSEDNVIIGVAPGGGSKTYTYVIPANHLPGTHWYHSHHHGSSSLQVQGGMVGMIVVDVPDFEESPPTEVDTFATESARTQWAGMPVSRMSITHHALCSCNPTGAGFSLRSYSTLREVTGDNIPLGAELVENSDGSQTQQVLLVNGQRQPVREMRVGVWNRFELLNAVGDVYLEIELRTAVALGGGGATACEMMLLSLDGVFPHSGARSISHVLMVPASRAGIAVRCSSAGEFYLQSNPTERASAYDVGFLQNLVTLSVSAAGGDDGTTDAPVLAEADVHRPNYLQNLLDATPVSEWQVATRQGGVVGGGNWLGVGENCATLNDCPQLAFAFPESDDESRKLENFRYRHVGRLCDVEDVVINGGGATPHPLHFHVNHFQVVSYAGNAATLAQWGEVGDWRDTIPAIGGGQLRFRHALDEHGGNVMVHCHFLWHEDQGMMDRYYIAANNADGTGSVDPCTANAAGFCDDSVPSSAFDNAYPQIPGSCSVYRSAAGDAVPQPPTE